MRSHEPDRIGRRGEGRGAVNKGRKRSHLPRLGVLCCLGLASGSGTVGDQSRERKTASEPSISARTIFKGFAGVSAVEVVGFRNFVNTIRVDSILLLSLPPPFMHPPSIDLRSLCARRLITMNRNVLPQATVSGGRQAGRPTIPYGSPVTGGKPCTSAVLSRLHLK